jgi:hypothetical protein
LINIEQSKQTSRKFDFISGSGSELKLKIALVSFSYKRYSYFYTLFSNIKDTDRDYWSTILGNDGLSEYVVFFQKIEKNMYKLIENKNYFTGNIMEIDSLKYYVKRIIFYCMNKVFTLLHIRGLVLKTDEFFGFEREMD